MGLMKFSITKESTFQGKLNRWANVYTFDMLSETESALNTQIDALIAAERPIHSTAVQFVEARAFTTFHLQGISDIGSTFVVRPITSTAGQSVPDTAFYRELAFLCKWELPRKVGIIGNLGRQRSLKKWIHACTTLGQSGAQLAGTSAMAAPGPLTTYMSTVANIAGNQLCSDDGTRPAGPGTVHPWLEHRQFPRGRKEV